MNIRINSEQELIEVCTEALHIISNLRKFTKLWEQNHGVELKQRKKYYEDKADELIKRLQVGENRRSESINIEINATTNTTEKG